MSRGRTELQVVCGEGCHLLLQCCKVGLVIKKEGLAVGVGVGKIGDICSRTGIVDAGVNKCLFLVVQGLHGVDEQCTEVGPDVLTNRLPVPSAQKRISKKNQAKNCS